MGRRKKAAKVVKKKVRHEVDTVFKCLFCNHEKSVVCKLNLSSMIGDLVCRICDAKFETQINSLTDPIDVFSEWLDEAQDIQDEEMRRQKQGLPSQSTGFVGDGADYVDDEDGGDMGEHDDDAVVGDEEDEEGAEGEGEGEGGSDAEDVTPMADYVDADDDL